MLFGELPLYQFWSTVKFDPRQIHLQIWRRLSKYKDEENMFGVGGDQCDPKKIAKFL